LVLLSKCAKGRVKKNELPLPNALSAKREKHDRNTDEPAAKGLQDHTKAGEAKGGRENANIQRYVGSTRKALQQRQLRTFKRTSYGPRLLTALARIQSNRKVWCRPPLC
jgi:hypothetical protein